MLPEVEELAAVVGLPDHDVSVAVGGREKDAVRTEVGARDPLGVLRDQVELLAVGHVVALHLLGVGADDDPAVIRGDVGGHQLVELLARLGDASSGAHVPDHGVAQLAAAAAAEDEQRAVGAELERAGVALGVRQDAGQLAGFGVVEKDLLLTCDGEQRGPGARGHGDDRGGARGDDHGLEQHVLGARGGPVGLARGTGHGQLDLGAAGLARDAVLGLQRAALDPLGQRREVLGVQRGAFRRHERLLLLGAARPETAGRRIARVDDRAAGAAVHETGVARQLKAALLLVRVVAREALVLKERPDVVVVRQLVLRLGADAEQGGADEGPAAERADAHRCGAVSG